MYDDYINIDFVEMGHRIRERREFLKMTREWISEILGISQSFLPLVECGARGLSMRNIYILSQILKVPMDYLTFGIKADEKDHAEFVKAKDRIMSILSRCNAKQLREFEVIAKIYVSGTKDMND